MKHQPGFTDFFMSPVTGRIILPMLPDLNRDYVWVGNRGDRPLPSPVIIDLRLEIVDLRRRLSQTRFILQAASQDFDSSQALNELIDGILKHESGIVSIAIPGTDYMPVELPYKNIWIGDEENVPQPHLRIFLDNMADLPEGHLWLGTDSSDPDNFGPNRPVPIIVLPLANMADLPEGKIWRGNSGDRPEPSDALTSILSDIASIFSSLSTISSSISSILESLTSLFGSVSDINIEIGDINIEIGDINVSIEAILELIADITVDFGDIIIRLDGLDDIVIDLQAQIDANVASGLDHLADLQLQIDTNVASGLDALATINIRLDALELAITDINASITTINTTITSILSDITTIQTAITSILSEITTINTAITSILSDITSIFASISTINTAISTINTTIIAIQSDITNITTVLIPAIYTYIDTSIGDITLSGLPAGGDVDLDGNRIINLQCDPEEDNDAVSFCFLWHALHDEVTISWPWGSEEAPSNLTVSGILPDLSVKGDYQRFKFGDNDPSIKLQTYSPFVPTVANDSIINIESRNSDLSGYRWKHTTRTTDVDNYGQFEFQFYENAADISGTTIFGFDQTEVGYYFPVNMNLNPIVAPSSIQMEGAPFYASGIINFPGTYQARRIVLLANANNDFSFTGFGTDTDSSLVYNVKTGGSHAFYVETSSSTKDLLVKFNNTSAIFNQPIYGRVVSGLMSWSSSGTVTNASAGNWLKVNGTTTFASTGSEITMPSNNRLTYVTSDASSPVPTVLVTASISFKWNAALVSGSVSFGIYKNGTTLIAPVSISTVTAAVNDFISATTQVMTTMNTTDYLELWCMSSVTQNSAITVVNAAVSVQSV